MTRNSFVVRMNEHLLVWYSTTSLRSLMSSLYTLQAAPARVRSAVRLESVLTTLEAA
jgi:hypothetical protein